MVGGIWGTTKTTKQTNKRTNTQTNKQTNQQTNKHTQTNQQTSKRTNRRTNKQTTEQPNTQTNQQTNTQTNPKRGLVLTQSASKRISCKEKRRFPLTAKSGLGSSEGDQRQLWGILGALGALWGCAGSSSGALGRPNARSDWREQTQTQQT